MQTVVRTEQFDWRAVERALVAVGQPAVGTGVLLTGGVIVTTARTALRAAGGGDPGQLVVRVLAASDHRWRGAEAGVLVCDITGDVALLGATRWVDGEGVDALTDLLHERHAVGVQDLEIGEPISLHVPTPSGAWIRFPGVVASDREVAITAGPIDSEAVSVVESWAGTPVFSDIGLLAGFLAHSTGTMTVVRRVDHLVSRSSSETVEHPETPSHERKDTKSARSAARSSHLCAGVSRAATAAYDFMTVAEAAAEARVSAKRMRTLINDGTLREGIHFTRPTGLRPRIIRQELLRWLQGHSPSTTAASSRPPRRRSKLNPALIRTALKPPR